METLPTANPEITQFFRQWLETFAGHVREVDYDSARPLFHPDVLAFGTMLCRPGQIGRDAMGQCLA